VLAVIAVALVLYGVYIALHVPALIVGTASPILLIGYAVQACAAIAGAVGLWRAAGWASAMVIVLGAAVVFTALGEAFILGIVAWAYAVLVSVVALLIALGIAAYARTGYLVK
jgi:hypothetical protein